MTDDSRELLPGAFDAAEDVLYYIDQLRDAKTLGEQADAFVALQNAASDLRSFHPGFDINSGTMPWDREEEETEPESENLQLTWTLDIDPDVPLDDILATVSALQVLREKWGVPNG